MVSISNFSLIKVQSTSEIAYEAFNFRLKLLCALKVISLTPRRARNASMPLCRNECNKVNICQQGFFKDLTLRTANKFWKTASTLSAYGDVHKARFQCNLMMVAKWISTVFWESAGKVEIASVFQTLKKHCWSVRQKIHDVTTHNFLCLVDYNHLIARHLTKEMQAWNTVLPLKMQ